MRILVLYGSTHGQTAKIAAALAQAVRDQGHAVDVREAGKVDCRPEDYAGVMVAASVHAGGYQKEVRRWVQAHAAALNTIPTAFVSVCLGILQHDPKVDAELQSIARRFGEATGWHPTIVKPVAGALPYTKYNWFLRRMMKRIAAKAGGDTDTSRDYEYTDWRDLRAFAEQFAHTVAGRPVKIATAAGA